MTTEESLARSPQGDDPARTTGQSSSLPAGLRVYLGMTLTLTALTLLSLAWYWYRGGGIADAQLISESSDRFGDLWHYHDLFRYFHTTAFFTSQDRFAYPAPLAVVYALLYACAPHTHLVFNCLLAAAALLSAVKFFQSLRSFSLSAAASAMLPLTLLITSYPWLMLGDRANLEIFVYIFLASGVWLYLSGRSRLAAVLWGCAGALKVYPLVLLMVFLYRKTIITFLLGAGTAVVVFLSSCWYVGPTLATAALGSFHGVTGFLGHYAGAARRSELNQDHSILGGIKEILSLNMLHLGQDWPRLSLVYEASVVIVAPFVYFRWVRRLPLLNQLCLFLTALQLLPPVSYDYTLVHSYLVMGIVTAAYLTATAAKIPFPRAKAFYVAFAILGTSQGWVQLRGLRINGIVKSGTLLAILVLLLMTPLTIGAGEEVQAVQ